MPIAPNTEIDSHPEFQKDPTILVQAFVLERLHLDDDPDVAAMKYGRDGYSAKCRELMETDSDVKSLLAHGRLDEAATLLTYALERWKRS
jgi:hypothetical protein